MPKILPADRLIRALAGFRRLWGGEVMAAPTITRETVENDLTTVLRRLRRARELEDFVTADVYEAEIDRLLGWWQRIAQGKPRPNAGSLSGQ